MLLLTACQKEEEKNINCNYENSVESSTLNDNIGFAIPNILITDDNGFGKFNLILSERDQNFQRILIKPTDLNFSVHDEDNNLLFVNNTVIQENDNSIFLWDGFANDQAYEGFVSYELFVVLDDQQSFHVIGQFQVTNCEALNDCGMEDTICDLINCRYFGHLIYSNQTFDNCF